MSSTEDLFRQGLLAYNRKDYEDAEDLFKQVIKQDPFSSEAYLNLGNVYFKQTMLPEAEDMWKKALEINPMEEKAYLNLGNMHYGNQEYDRAIDYWEIFQKLEPAHANINLNLGMAYEQMQRMPEAFLCYNLYIKSRGMGPEAQQLKTKIEEAKSVGEHNLKQAEIFMRTGQLQKAQQAFSESLNLIPVHPKIYKHYATVLYQLGEYEEACLWYEKAVDRINDDCGLVINLGVLFDKQGRLFEAMWAYDLAIRMDPHGIAEKVKKRFEILWNDQGRDILDSALRDVQAKVEGQHYNEAQRMGQRLFDFAVVKAPAKVPPIRNILEFLSERKDPKQLAAKVAFNLGENCRENGQYEKAMRFFDRYLELLPNGDKLEQINQYKESMTKQISAVVGQMLSEDKSPMSAA